MSLELYPYLLIYHQKFVNDIFQDPKYYSHFNNFDEIEKYILEIYEVVEQNISENNLKSKAHIKAAYASFWNNLIGEQKIIKLKSDIQENFISSF